MSFGQTASPASAKQVQYLLALVKKAGHTDFRDARGPLGFTQRQAGGKFSRTEAAALIDQLLAAPTAEDDAGGDDAGGDASATEGHPRAGLGSRVFAEDRLATERATILQGMPADLLVAELERRGWQVSAPARASAGKG